MSTVLKPCLHCAFCCKCTRYTALTNLFQCANKDRSALSPPPSRLDPLHAPTSLTFGVEENELSNDAGAGSLLTIHSPSVCGRCGAGGCLTKSVLDIYNFYVIVLFFSSFLYFYIHFFYKNKTFFLSSSYNL